jgi:alpha-tubulin suppressor-like RCC1 family protein
MMGYARGWGRMTLAAAGVASCQAADPRGVDRAADAAAAQDAGPLMAVSAGFGHTCALTAAGVVKCWGVAQLPAKTSDIPVDVVGLPSGVRAVSAGAGHTCVLTDIGGVRCWGANSYGEVGLDPASVSDALVDVAGLSSGALAISAEAQYHACALTSAGAVQCWGRNTFGQLGSGTAASSHLPIEVTGLSSGVLAISVGGSHSCALTSAGAAKCWGWNSRGQLGDGSRSDSRFPADVVGLSSGVLAISAGGHHTCALTTAGAVKCWGGNELGQLGDGSTTDSRVPVDVVGLSSGVVAISAGGRHTCALATGGTVECWGAGGHGQLGDGSDTGSDVPVDVVDLSSGVLAVSAGWYHTCAVAAVGGAKCWGWNYGYQLGNGSRGGMNNVPVDVVGL